MGWDHSAPQAASSAEGRFSLARLATLGTAAALAAMLSPGGARAQMAPPVVTATHIGHWASEPTFAEVEAAKPAGVTGRGIVSFQGCGVGDDGRLKDCAVKAQPDDARLRKAAEALIPRYQFSAADAKAIQASQGRVDFYVGWRADGACGPPFCRPAPAGTAPPAPPRK